MRPIRSRGTRGPSARALTGLATLAVALVAAAPHARAFFAGGAWVAAGQVDGLPEADLVTGAGPGGGPHVRVFRVLQPSGVQALGPGFFPYGVAFAGGVRVAACDTDGDGRAELVTAPGPGGGPHVRVLQVDAAGQPTGVVADFLAYGAAFAGGVFVACGDVAGLGAPQIVTGAGAGGGPHVRVFALAPGAPGGAVPVLDFFAYDPAFTGGVRVAVGDVDGTAPAEIVTGPGPGGEPAVRVFRVSRVAGGALQASILTEVLAYAPAFAGGVFVAAAHIDTTGGAEVITGAGAGGGPHVRILRYDGGAVFTPLAEILAFDPLFAGGVAVAGARMTNALDTEVLAAAGPGGGAHVRSFFVSGATARVDFLAY
jgi:hypothetical protein